MYCLLTPDVTAQASSFLNFKFPKPFALFSSSSSIDLSGSSTFIAEKTKSSRNSHERTMEYQPVEVLQYRRAHNGDYLEDYAHARKKAAILLWKRCPPMDTGFLIYVKDYYLSLRFGSYCWPCYQSQLIEVESEDWQDLFRAMELPRLLRGDRHRTDFAGAEAFQATMQAELSKIREGHANVDLLEA